MPLEICIDVERFEINPQVEGELKYSAYMPFRRLGMSVFLTVYSRLEVFVCRKMLSAHCVIPPEDYGMEKMSLDGRIPEHLS